jgi:hypothetical protein
MDGDTVKLRIVGEPRVHIDNYGNTRFANVVYNYTAGKAQVYSYGKSILKQLQELEGDDEWGDPQNYDIKVSRKGSGQMDTEYLVNPSPNRKALDKEQTAEVESVDLKVVIPTSIAIDKFATGEQPQASKPVVKDTVIEDIDDSKPIDMSEIPFR